MVESGYMKISQAEWVVYPEVKNIVDNAARGHAGIAQ